MGSKHYSNIPNEALRQIVDEFGESILTENRLKNILSDILTGNDRIIKIIEQAIKDKVGVRLLALQKMDAADRAIQLSNIRQSFQEDNFFQFEVSNYVIDCFMYALGWIDHVKEYKEPSIQKSPANTQLNQDAKPEIKQAPKLTPQIKPIPEITKLVSEVNNPPSVLPLPTKRRLSKLIILLFILLIAIGCFIFFYNVNSSPYYTIANTTNLYSKTEKVDADIIAQIPYGSKLIVKKKDSDWSDIEYNNKKGYIISSDILSSKDFNLLNSIFGNEESYKCISLTRYRLALLDYYKKNGLYGKPESLSSQTKNKDIYGWQVYTNNLDMKPNNVFFPALYNPNSKFSDFAVILKNNNTSERRLIYYSFSDDETPVFRYEEPAPETGYIKAMKVKGYQVETFYAQ